MNQAKLGLLTTFLLGIFILIGALIALLINKKEKVVDFSLGLAFGVITTLIITDLLPEVYENLELNKIYLAIIFTIVGYVLLRLLDKFIPDHDEHEDGHHHAFHMNKKEASDNLIHIGVITSLALALHNIIEGMAVYLTILSSTNLGLAVTLGVGFHNIPLGMVIAGALYQSGANKYKIALNIILVSLSTFAGGLILFFFNVAEISPIILGILLSITLGMLVFIAFTELLPRIMESRNKKVSYTGIAIGVLILVIAVFIGE